MTKIAPLRAVIYNQDKVKDISKVVCPPYDVISSLKQEALYQRHPHNFIRILLRKDIPNEDKYAQVKNLFEQWLREGILIRDENPAMYFYSQQFIIDGKKKQRLGFITRLYLGGKKKAVYGHENTRRAALEDRLKILRAVSANLSPIFLLFSDKRQLIERLWSGQVSRQKPFIDLVDDEKTRHRLWRLADPKLISAIQSLVSGGNVFIADGHHRYQVAAAYRDEMESNLGRAARESDDFNYVLAYVTAVESKGLSIMPIHRLVKLKPGFDLARFLDEAGRFFQVKEFKGKSQLFSFMEKAAGKGHVFAMAYLKRYWSLSLKNELTLDELIPDKPKEYRYLDVSILNALVFTRILKLDVEKENRVEYGVGAGELIEQAQGDAGSIVFLLNPVKVRQVMAVSLKNERMPAKSTYFYPKVLSGMVINRFGKVSAKLKAKS